MDDADALGKFERLAALAAPADDLQAETLCGERLARLQVGDGAHQLQVEAAGAVPQRRVDLVRPQPVDAGEGVGVGNSVVRVGGLVVCSPGVAERGDAREFDAEWVVGGAAGSDV